MAFDTPLGWEDPYVTSMNQTHRVTKDFLESPKPYGVQRRSITLATPLLQVQLARYSTLAASFRRLQDRRSELTFLEWSGLIIPIGPRRPTQVQLPRVRHDPTTPPFGAHVDDWNPLYLKMKCTRTMQTATNASVQATALRQ